MVNKKVYFPNLNALRFIAAMLVLFAHTELTKADFGLPNYSHIPSIIVGHLGVILFFVLSGFLITYLLLTEDAVNDKINIRQFYLRRMLRIWPLYFIVCILGLFVLPHLSIFGTPYYTPELIGDHFPLKVTLYMLFLPNLAYALFTNVPYLNHCWSIGTEEQFYLVWPWLTRFMRKGKKLFIFPLIVILYLLVRASNKLVPSTDLIDRLYTFWALFSIQCMAIGGFFAYIIFKHLTAYIKVLFHPVVFGATLIGCITCILFGVAVPHFDYEFYAVLFGIIIVNLACNEKIGGVLENRVTNYLGKISYGLYMYHNMVIILAINILQPSWKGNNFVLYPMVIAGSIAIASVSYYLVEGKFIEMKRRFATIVSGDDARKELSGEPTGHETK